MCDFAAIVRSSYYKWLNRVKTAIDKENSSIIKELIRIYDDVNGIHGYRRMTMNINISLNKQYNYKRIYSLMKSINLQSLIRNKRKRYVKNIPQITAENVLNRDFSSATLNEKYKLTNRTKAYLSTIIDLYDNSIVLYVLGHSNNNKLVFDTFDLAIEKNPSANPLFHNDRGYQYTSKTFKLKLDKVSATQSMSRTSRCIDNRPIEGF